MSFQHVCCFHEDSTYADKVKIGEEPVPWMCSTNYEYLVLEFRAPHPKGQRTLDEADILAEVYVRSQLEGCL